MKRYRHRCPECARRLACRAGEPGGLHRVRCPQHGYQDVVDRIGLGQCNRPLSSGRHPLMQWMESGNYRH